MFIFARPACQNPARTNPFVNIPRTPMTPRAILYGIPAPDIREPLIAAAAAADVVASSLPKSSVCDVGVTSSSQSTVDSITNYCGRSSVSLEKRPPYKFCSSRRIEFVDHCAVAQRLAAIYWTVIGRDTTTRVQFGKNECPAVTCGLQTRPLADVDPQNFFTSAD